MSGEEPGTIIEVALAASAKPKGDGMIDILQVTDPGCCGGRRLDEDGCCVACGRDFFDPDTGEEAGDGTRVPNASLSGAALDLLEAAEETVASLGYFDSWPMQQLRAAIAKAKGK